MDPSAFRIIHPPHHIFKEHRERLRMTPSQVARCAGIKRKEYMQIETGEKDIEERSFRAGLMICKVLQINPYLLLGD